MPRVIESPTVIQAVGNTPKQIEEFVGRVNSGDDQLSVARMKSPEGWVEPGQTPMFREVTVVLNGTLQVESRDGKVLIARGYLRARTRGSVQYSRSQWRRICGHLLASIFTRNR